MGPVNWVKDFFCYEMVIHYGVSGAQDIRLIDCQVDNFRFDCQDGGMVVVRFRDHPPLAERTRPTVRDDQSGGRDIADRAGGRQMADSR